LLLLLLALLVLAYFIYRHSQNKAQTAPLSEDEQQKMAQIIKDVQS
jgi:lipopolysaccharide export system protein LptC